MYKFPHITCLNQVRDAIEGRDEFFVAERDWGYVVNYMVNLIDSFPAPTTKDPELNEKYKIRRECRGIKFGLDGNIIARPYSKFFNLGERAETFPEVINWDQKFIILDKLDGSNLPELYGVILTSRGDGLSVRTKGNRRDRVIMAGKN